MNKKDYLLQYQDKGWYDLSKRIKARDKNVCQMCGRQDLPISVHHKTYSDGLKVWEYPDDELICICDKCHTYVTEVGRNLYDEYKCLKQKFRDVGFSDNILSGIFNHLMSAIDNVIEGEESNNPETINFLHSVVLGTQDYNDLKTLKRFGVDDSELVKDIFPNLYKDYTL